MNLTLNKEEGANNRNICEFILNKLPEPKFESLSEEIIIKIEKNIFNDKNGISLYTFFEDLDSHLAELKIKSYSVSMPTLEDVFLNVVQEDERDKVNQKTLEHLVNDMALFELNFLNTFTPFQKFLYDIKLCCIKRFYLIIRDKKDIIIEIFFPIILILLGCLISKMDLALSTPIFGSKDISSLGNQIIYYSSLNQSINKENYFIKNILNVTSKNLTLFDQSLNETKNDKSLAIYKFIESLYVHTEDSKSFIENYGSFLLLNEPNAENKNYEFVELIDSRVVQGVPLFTSIFLEQIIKKASNNKVNINYQHKVMGKTAKQEKNSGISSNNVVLFVAAAYALISSNFINIIVKERVNNSKHLMKLSGMNILSYWIVNFLFEIIKYYFAGGICLIILSLFDYYTPYLINFYLMYGPPLILMTYVMSFLFSDESGAQSKTILFHIFVGTLGSTMIFLFREVEKASLLGKILGVFLSLIPSFCFCLAYNIGRNKELIYNVDFKDNILDYIYDDSKLMEDFFLLLGPFSFLIIDTLIYLTILILIEVLSNKEICSKNQDQTINNIEQRDSGVIKEELRAQNEKKKIEINGNEIRNINNDDNYVVRVKNLGKEYTSYIYNLFYCFKKNKGKIAIKNLNFCLEKGE